MPMTIRTQRHYDRYYFSARQPCGRSVMETRGHLVKRRSSRDQYLSPLYWLHAPRLANPKHELVLCDARVAHTFLRTGHTREGHRSTRSEFDDTVFSAFSDSEHALERRSSEVLHSLFAVTKIRDV